MAIKEILNLSLSGIFGSDKEEKENKEAAEMVDEVIKKNKKTFDELAKH